MVGGWQVFLLWDQCWAVHNPLNGWVKLATPTCFVGCLLYDDFTGAIVGWSCWHQLSVWHSPMSTLVKWMPILAVGMLVEIWLLLPVGYDLHKPTQNASTYSLPTSGRFLSYNPSELRKTLANDKRSILPLPRSMIDQNADQQVLDVAIHQHPIAMVSKR